LNAADYLKNGSKKSGPLGFAGELQIFFGSIFYPKDMKQTLEDVEYPNSRQKVDLIHKTLYMFSNNNLHILLRDSPAFRFILDESLKSKNEIFANYLKTKKPTEFSDNKKEE